MTQEEIYKQTPSFWNVYELQNQGIKCYLSAEWVKQFLSYCYNYTVNDVVILSTLMDQLKRFCQNTTNVKLFKKQKFKVFDEDASKLLMNNISLYFGSEVDRLFMHAFGYGEEFSKFEFKALLIALGKTKDDDDIKEMVISNVKLFEKIGKQIYKNDASMMLALNIEG